MRNSGDAPADRVIARRLRLRDLHTLQTVVEAGSMARAAERLALSQPAISKVVAEMEQALGVALLERSPRGVEPTAYGRVLLARGAAMQDELRQAVEEIRFLRDPGSGEVRIGATEPMTALVADAIERLAPRHPRLSFTVQVGDTSILLQGVRERALDLAITRTDGQAAAPDLAAETLFLDPLAVMAGEGHPLARRRAPLALSALMEEPWVGTAGRFLADQIAQAFRTRGLAPPPAAVVTPSVQMRVALLRGGRFLCMLPEAMLRLHLQYPGLVRLPVDLSDTRRPIALVTLARRGLGPAPALFAEQIRAVARRLAGRGQPRLTT